jgi:hypothetical protein
MTPTQDATWQEVVVLSQDATWEVEPQPLDGSCLFHCLTASLTEGTWTPADLREVVAQQVIQDGEGIRAFIEDNMPWETYVEQIRNPASWGGEQDIAIIWRHFNTREYQSDTRAFGTSPLSIRVYDGDAGTWHTQIWGPHDATRTVILLRVNSNHYDLIRFGSASLIIGSLS